MQGNDNRDASRTPHSATNTETSNDGNSVAPDIFRNWQNVRIKLRTLMGEAAFTSWFGKVALAPEMAQHQSQEKCERIVLTAPSRFVRNWIVAHHSDNLLNHWVEENTNITAVDVVLTSADIGSSRGAYDGNQERKWQGSDLTLPTSGQLTQSVVYGQEASRSVLNQIGAPLDPLLTFESFMVGKSNELAHAAAQRVADATNVTFNPLFLYGGVGLGKTHLMHAIAWEIRRRHPERKVVYLSAEKFMYQFIRALRYKDTMAFKRQFREVDVLMVDDIQFIAGKNSTQEEFFHTFNALVEHNHQIIVSADRSPSDLDGVEERIRSRLGWGLVADIHPTDYELRLSILQSRAEKETIHIPPEVLEFLAQRISSNVRELEGALRRVLAYADFKKRPVDVETSQEILRDLLRANNQIITIDSIQRQVAEYYNIRMADMLSARRSRPIVRPRQVAMYLSKHLTSTSLPEIGRKFGGRDHTTVIHAVRKVDELRNNDQSIGEDIKRLMRLLEG
ncbi:MAG: chromosomal replication initiator protein DnaA [Parvularculales bacterium]